jgi:hypothetical protein
MFSLLHTVTTRSNRIKNKRNTIRETTSDASPKQSNRPLRLTHHQHEYDSKKIQIIGSVITTQDAPSTPMDKQGFYPIMLHIEALDMVYKPPK